MEYHSFVKSKGVGMRLKLSRKTTRNHVNTEIELKTKLLISYDSLEEISCFALSLFGNNSFVAQFDWFWRILLHLKLIEHFFLLLFMRRSYRSIVGTEG